MTVLVDTSAWVEFLHGTGSREHRWLRRAVVDEEPVAWTDPVLYELAAGAGSQERADELRSLLLRGPRLPVGLTDWEDAARLYRAARSQGLTVRSTVDCLVAAVALRTATPILARDPDFGVLAGISELELVTP